GFRLFEGVSWSEIATEKIDFYYKVDGKKENSTVMFLISKGYDNFITSAKDPLMVNNTKNVLNNLVNDIAAVQRQQQIAEQIKVVKAAEDKCGELKKAYDKLVSEKEKIENEMSKNRDQQQKCESEASAQKQKLE